MVEFAKFYVIGLLCLMTNGCATVHYGYENYQQIDSEYTWKSNKNVIIHKCNENVTGLPELLSGRSGVITYQMKCRQI